MRKLGEVILILNERFVAVRTNEPIILGSEVIAFTEFPLDEVNKQRSGLESVQVPKGKLRVILRQQENVYILSVINKSNTETDSNNENLARSLSTFHSIFSKANSNENSDNADGNEGVIADYSAKIDPNGSLNISLNPLVTFGDFITYNLND